MNPAVTATAEQVVTQAADNMTVEGMRRVAEQVGTTDVDAAVTAMCAAMVVQVTGCTVQEATTAVGQQRARRVAEAMATTPGAWAAFGAEVQQAAVRASAN